MNAAFRQTLNLRNVPIVASCQGFDGAITAVNAPSRTLYGEIPGNRGCATQRNFDERR